MPQSDRRKRTRAELVRSRRQIQKTGKKPIDLENRSASRNNSTIKQYQNKSSNSKQSNKTRYNQASYKRKVYVPINASGTEIRLPSIPNIHIGWRLASGILSLIMISLIIGLREMEIFRVSASSIHVEGAQRISTEDLFIKSNLDGVSIVEIIPNEIETRILKEFLDLKIADVVLKLPSQVKISLEERLPAVLWENNNDGSSTWIDEEGYSFPVRGEATLPVQVIAYGEAPKPMEFNNIMSPAEDANIIDSDVDKLGPSIDPLFVAAILKIRNFLPPETNLIYEPQYGLGWEDPRGWKVYFGTDTENIELKLEEYKTIVQELQNRNITPGLISLEFLHAPFYRLEQ